MGIFAKGLDIVLHLDKYIGFLLSLVGNWTYLILFLVVFAETGFVFTPFLPGDSLLFAAGAFAAQGYFNLFIIFVILLIAAIAGDSVNYWIGLHIGEKFLLKRNLMNPSHLEKTKLFYGKYGKKTIIFARFIPIVRTFAPFVAGIGKMEYPVFLLYNVIGGIFWICLFVLGGYFFGNIQLVQDHFSLFVMLIILLSFIPLIIELVKHFREKLKNRKGPE